MPTVNCGRMRVTVHVPMHDVQTDSKFYHAILGYTIDVLPTDQGLQQVELESGGYARTTLNEIPHDGSGLNSRWINFVRVENVRDTVAKAVALGGRTLVGPLRTSPGRCLSSAS